MSITVTNTPQTETSQVTSSSGTTSSVSTSSCWDVLAAIINMMASLGDEQTNYVSMEAKTASSQSSAASSQLDIEDTALTKEVADIKSEISASHHHSFWSSFTKDLTI